MNTLYILQNTFYYFCGVGENCTRVQIVFFKILYKFSLFLRQLADSPNRLRQYEVRKKQNLQVSFPELFRMKGLKNPFALFSCLTPEFAYEKSAV